ncbi:MAG TPA: clostripain-related cysteine peptidase [Pyrinomonadaceae bacterium]|jgi:hypothetical protein
MSKSEGPKWTIMVYLAGDNDLTSYCVSVLQQLEAVKYGKEVCVLACFESNTPWPKGSRYLRVNCVHRQVEKAFDWDIHNDLITPNGNGKGNHRLDCDSPFNESQGFSRPVVAEGLRRFLDWAIQKHADSDRFMLILFGHGPLVAGQTFLVAENPASFLRLEDLQDILGEHFGESKRRLDILAFQNCVMNGVETAYEIRDHADYMIGSQGLVLATGWPYDKMIGEIVKRPSASPKAIARKLLKVCARNMLDFTIMDRSSEQSACNLEALRDSSNITAALKRLVRVLNRALNVDVDKEKQQRVLVYPALCDAVKLARLEAQSYWNETFVDLYDFCERLIQKCNDIVKRYDKFVKQLDIEREDEPDISDNALMLMAKEVISGCIDVMKEVTELVPSSHSYYIGSELQYSHGISIYFPWTLPPGPYFSKPMRSRKEYRLETPFETYSRYSFVRESEWGDFLNVFFKATLRNMRRGNRTFALKNDMTSLSDGVVQEHHLPFRHNAFLSDLTKSSPDTARVDDLSFTIKNYPRRNYLSPLDCPRKIEHAKSLEPGTKGFENPKSPPPSALGWNFSTLVAEVIQKRTRKRRKPPATAGKALTKAAGR